MASKFISETELAEARRLRQEEWDKVRTADQPIEAPEEEYDPRSLFERLQEQKQKKDLEFEEAHKLKNMIKGLDDDEVEFLDLVDKNKLNAEKRAQLEERKELSEFRARVATLQEKRHDEQIQQQISKPKPTKAPVTSSRLSQKQILAGAVVRKRKIDSESATAELPPVAANKERKVQQDSTPVEQPAAEPSAEENVATANEAKPVPKKVNNTGMRVIGILPGIGPYRESDDSDDSSDDSDFECGDHNWVERIVRKCEDHKKSA